MYVYMCIYVYIYVYLYINTIYIYVYIYYTKIIALQYHNINITVKISQYITTSSM